MFYSRYTKVLKGPSTKCQFQNVEEILVQLKKDKRKNCMILVKASFATASKNSTIDSNKVNSKKPHTLNDACAKRVRATALRAGKRE